MEKLIRLAAISSVVSSVKDMTEADMLPELCRSKLYQYGLNLCRYGAYTQVEVSSPLYASVEGDNPKW
jgi:hypothetical protein